MSSSGQACPRCLLCEPIVRSLQLFCENLGDDPVKWKDLDYFPDFPVLRGSAMKGCRLCEFLRLAIIDDFRLRPVSLEPRASHDTLSHWNKNVSFQSQKLYGIGQCPLRLQLNLGGATRSIDMTMYDPSDTASQEIIDLDPDPLCKETTTLIQSWIGDCISTHDGCKLSKESYVPTRLIDLGGTDENQHPRIIRGATILEKVDYVALSYCWGRPPPTQPDFRTLSGNLEARYSQIQTDGLPMTLQDAIKATRQLGVRYLWVDCLCIVQNDLVDWERESANMGDTFRHAYITIAATSATSMSEGFLQRPKCRTISISDISLNTEDQVNLRYPMFLGQDIILKSEWNRRGWVFQERKLSPRILHFSYRTLYFECGFGIKSEVWDQMPHLLEQHPWNWKPGVDLELLGHFKSKGMISYISWYEGVEEFSGRCLTVSTDKLPALSGLAKETKIVLDDEYLAGLWRRDIYRGILWKAKHNTKLISPQVDRAPSWSWASLDGRVEWPLELLRGEGDTLRTGRDFKEIATILKSETIPATVDPTGQVKTGGRLVFRGSLIPILWVLGAKDPDWDHISEVYQFTSDLGVEFSGASNLWLLPIMRYSAIYGLILELTNATSHEYRRFGWFLMHNGEWCSKWLRIKMAMDGKWIEDFPIIVM